MNAIINWFTLIKYCQGTEQKKKKVLQSSGVIAGTIVVGSSVQNEIQTEKTKKKEEPYYYHRNYYKNLWTKAANEIGHGCSQGQDAGSGITLEGKILTVVNKFLTTSPLVNKVKLLMVSQNY